MNARLNGTGADKVPRGPGASLRVVIAEDHPEHRQWLLEALSRLRPAWEVCAAVSTVAGLKEAVDEHVPSLLLLDVHLDGGLSLEVIDQLPYPVPIIFTSGDPKFAIEAFEHAALDYVLKPLRASRLERALARADAAAAQRQQQAGGEDSPPWLLAKRGEATAIIMLSDVIFLQSQAKYTRVITRGGESLIKRGLGIIEQQLDPRQFKRIHRSTIINVRHAGALVRDDLGRLKLQMNGRGEWLYVSKPFEKVFKVV